MRLLQSTFLLAVLFLGACSYFDSEPDKPPLEGERISIMDLQKELQPSSNADALKSISVPVATLNKNWPQAGGYAHHAMQNLALGETGQLELIWNAEIGTGSTKKLPLTAQPVVSDGVVFTLDTESRVRAFHAQTGKFIWESDVSHQVEEEAVISGGIAYDGGILFVTSGYNEVLALNPEDGSIYWRTTIAAASRAAPTVKNGRVFVTAMNNNVIALDAKEGKIIWEYQGVSETTGLLGAASPAADEKLVVAALSSGDLVALRADNGSIVWQDSLSNSLRYGGNMVGLSDIRGLPVIYGDAVIAVSYGGKMAVIDKNKGFRLWQRKISSAETPWVSGNTIYVQSADYKLVSLNIQSGEVLWVTDLQKYEDPAKRKNLITWTGPVMAGDRLILAGTDGRVAEYNPKDGSKLTERAMDRTVRISPVVAHGALLLLAEDGSLLAYR